MAREPIYIEIPDIGTRLMQGDLVRFQDSPTKYLVHNGNYTVDGVKGTGWYLQAIPTQHITPINDPSALSNIKLLDSRRRVVDAYEISDGEWEVASYSCPIPSKPTPPPACKPKIDVGAQVCPAHIYPPHFDKTFPAFFSQALKKQLAGAFIVVPSMEKLYELDTYNMPDGKMACVYDSEGEPHYYAWHLATRTWEPFDFATIKPEDVERVLATKHIVAGKGLVGGGALNEDVVIAHDDTGTGDPITYHGTSSQVIQSIEVDEFGHVADAQLADVGDIVSEDPRIAKCSELFRWKVYEYAD